jgi:hypothetical protein
MCTKATYAVFAGHDAVMLGGWRDMKIFVDTTEDAYKFLVMGKFDWWEIVQFPTMEMVDKFYGE